MCIRDRFVTADPIVRLRSRVGRRDDVVFVRVSGDHVSEVLLDAPRFRRVIVCDEEQPHGQIPGCVATLYDEICGPVSPKMTSVRDVLRGTGSTSRRTNGRSSRPATYALVTPPGVKTPMFPSLEAATPATAPASRSPAPPKLSPDVPFWSSIPSTKTRSNNTGSASLICAGVNPSHVCL